MNDKILNHYLQFSLFTNPGCYKETLKNSLPDKIEDIGLLVRKQIIHRVTLRNGNTGSNQDLRYGDMTKLPWWRQCEDDNLPSAAAMLAELFRRDNRGFVINRAEPDRLVLTCRLVAVLMVSILKAKGIPARVRSGFAPYFELDTAKNKSVDHWINQYWNKAQNRWIAIDVDGSLEDNLKFNPYDITADVFDFSADAWLNVRAGKIDEKHFWNAGGKDGLVVVAWELFHDFHCLMNHEEIYLHHPEPVMSDKFNDIKEDELTDIDNLARLMQKPDDNFEKLQNIWQTNKKYRLLKGGLL